MALAGSCQTLKCYGNKFQKSNEGQSSCMRQLSHSYGTFLHHAFCTLKEGEGGWVIGNISNGEMNCRYHFKSKQIIPLREFFLCFFSFVDCATITSSTFRCLPGESNVDQSTCIKSTCFVDHQGYSMKHTRGEISWFYNRKLKVNTPPLQKKKIIKKKLVRL